MTKKRRRSVHLHVMVTPEEQALIADRMAEAGISNMGAYDGDGYVCEVVIWSGEKETGVDR